MPPPRLVLLMALATLSFSDVSVGSLINDAAKYPVCVDDEDCWHTHDLDRGHACFGYVCLPRKGSHLDELLLLAINLASCSDHSDCNGLFDRCCNRHCCHEDYFKALGELPCYSDQKCIDALLGNRCCSDNTAGSRCCTTDTAPSPIRTTSFHILRPNWCSNNGGGATGMTTMLSAMGFLVVAIAFLMLTGL